MSWTHRNLNNIEYLNYLIKEMNDAEQVIIKYGIDSLIMQSVIYNFEEYLEYEGIYVNQRKIAKTYLKRSIRILKKHLPRDMVITTEYLSYIL